MNIHRIPAAAMIGALLLAGAALPAAATDAAYPAKTVTMVVPFTAGSGTDVVARIVAEPLGKLLGATIVVDNRAGAGGTLGAAQVAAATPDGATVLVHSAGHVANAALYPKLKYDTLKDFTPVSLLATLPNVLVVAPSSQVGSVGELLKKVKANPGKLTYASAGNGSATHINAEKFRIAAGLQATHVPYRGTPPALMDVVGGQVDWAFAPLVSAMPLILEHKLVPLAVGTPKRAAMLPKVPTTLEAGLPGSDYTFWVGLFVPSRTPTATVAKLQSAIAQVLKSPETQAALAKLGADAGTLTQAQFAEQVAQEVGTTGELVRQAAIKLE